MSQLPPSIHEIEEILHSIQPFPRDIYHQHMATDPWKVTYQEKSGGFQMNQKYKYTGFVLLVLLVVFSILAITPIGAVLANEIVQFFKRTQGNTLPIPTDQVWQIMPSITPEPTRHVTLMPAAEITYIAPTATANPQPVPDAKVPDDLTIKAAAYYAGFEPYQPLNLPRDYRLTGILYDATQQSLTLKYASPRAGSGEFFQITEGKDLPPLTVGANATIENIDINGYPAQFVRGQWFVLNGSDQSTWENNAEIYTIRWQVKDIFISIQFFLNDSFYPAYVTRDEMLTTAHSLVVCPTTANTSDYACEIGQINAVGFIPWQLPAAPQGYTYQYADYRPDMTAIYYSNSTSQLGIFQSHLDFSQQQSDNIWDSVPADAIQATNVSNDPAEYVKGDFIIPPNTNEAVWKADAPRERLRWKNGEWWFQVNAWGNPGFGYETLVTLAQQIRPVANENELSTAQQQPTATYSTENALTSIEAVEALAGFDVLEPGLLPPETPFSHARYNPVFNSVMLFYGYFSPDKYHANGPVLIVSEYNRTDFPEPDRLYPPEAVEQVEVNGLPATITHGTLMTGMDKDGQAHSTPVWDGDSGSIAITWKEDGRYYSIGFNPSGEQNGTRLSTADLIKIAESLH